MSAKEDYLNDLLLKSEYPKTIQNQSDVADWYKSTPEETARKREEFDIKKADLKRQWEDKNGNIWPQYDQDVYSDSGKLIRKAGNDYDVHHIQPLSMGGENEVSNITPLHAKIHYDKQGIHAHSSPYSKLDSLLGEM